MQKNCTQIAQKMHTNLCKCCIVTANRTNFSSCTCITGTLNYTPWDWGQIGIQLETCYIAKVDKFYAKNYISVNRLENVISGM